MTNAQLVPVILAPLLAWRLYSRFRRSVGRQKPRPKRMLISIGIMTLVLGLIAFAMLHLGASLWPLVGGLAAGAGVGVIGCKLTRFEHIDGEKSYTPNAWLGIAVSMLLVARMTYRFFQLYTPGNQIAPTTPDLGHSPLTLFILGLTFGYYITYNAGVFLSLKTEQPRAQTQ